MTMMMSQRRYVVRLTRAGLRLGLRTNREGNAYIELDLDFADRTVPLTNLCVWNCEASTIV